MFDPISNHVQQALARLITQYKRSTKLKGLISAIVGPIQEIEDALTGMNTLRYLPDAVGVQLDVIGVIVGLARNPGEGDDPYRQRLYGRIAINFSQGQPEQAIQVFQLFTGAQSIVFTEFLCSVIVESEWIPNNQQDVDMIIGILEEVLPAGIRADGIVTFDQSNAFAYDGVLPGQGYDDGSQTVGGMYPTLWQFTGGGFAYDGDDSSGLGYGSIKDPLAGGVYLT